MEIDAITQFILAIVPAVTAIIGIVVALGVGVGKIKQANADTRKEVKNLSEGDKGLKKQLREVQKENAELKAQLNEVLARMKHLYFVEKPDKEE